MAESGAQTGKRLLAPADPPTADEPQLLAEAKLAAPRQRSGMLTRPRIEQLIETSADAAVTLVTAPAGYGKTTAVRLWSASTEAAVAWVTFDAGDNDPARLWTYVATAVGRVRGDLGHRALKRISLPGSSIDAAVDELMNAISGFGGQLAIVLDDVHTITDQECLESLAYAIEQLPRSARLIVMTRADPALPLARMRARGALVEIRAGDLALTTAEMRELLVDRGGLALEQDDIEILRERTEGWPAAVYLAALWLRTVDDQRRAVREFGGDQRFVAQYLSQEVLSALDPDERDFLLRAAALGKFTPDLCDAVLRRSDSAAKLAGLEQSNLFVLPLERREWFRLHALFGEFARARLESTEPGAELQIHRRAARWLHSQGLLIEATEHAAAAGDHRAVAALLSEYRHSLIRSGRSRTLLHWVRTLPDESVIERPDLALAAATAATLVGGLTLERRRWLQLARRAKLAHPDRFGIYEEAAMATVRADAIDAGVAQAIEDGRRAVELAERGADEVVIAALGSLARALYFAGELDAAWATASRALEHPDAVRRAPGYVGARSILALVAADHGWLASARGHADAARELVGRITSSRSWLGAWVAVALGAVLLGDGDLAGAERELAYGERFFRDEIATVHHSWLLVRLADIRRQRGRLDEARVTLRLAHDALAELGDSGEIPSLAARIEFELAQAERQATGGALLEAPSEAELAVLRLLTTDLSTREIASELFLSPNTVRSHTRAIYRKLQVQTRADAVARAGALGL
jgi:LuxR family transcriptional regulator, maltose regulon positive regulatory protein